MCWNRPITRPVRVIPVVEWSRPRVIRYIRIGNNVNKWVRREIRWAEWRAKTIRQTWASNAAEWKPTLWSLTTERNRLPNNLKAVKFWRFLKSFELEPYWRTRRPRPHTDWFRAKYVKTKIIKRMRCHVLQGGGDRRECRENGSFRKHHFA